MSFLRGFKKQSVDLSKLGLDESCLDLLYDLAIYGAVRSYFIHSDTILNAMLAVRPDSERVRIGMGLLALGRANYSKAEEVFKDDLLKLNPNSDFAKAYLGLTYKCTSKFDDARKYFNEVIASSKEPSLIALSKSCLEQIDKR